MFKLIPVLLLAVVATPAIASNGTAACSNLHKPFQLLAQLTVDPSVGNPPRVALCHRVANAYDHYTKGRVDKAIAELEKYIDGATRASKKQLPESYAQALISEAHRVIAILSGKPGELAKTVTGGVFTFVNKQPVEGAVVTLKFSKSGRVYTTYSDANGLFSFTDLTADGIFVLSASTPAGAKGTAHGSVTETEPAASVLLLVDSLGSGSIRGTVADSSGEPIPNALVTAIFPDTGRTYSTSTMADGTYALTNLHTDGTVIIIGFDGRTGASASTSRVLTSGAPSLLAYFELAAPTVVNTELLNQGFTNGLQGWSEAGSVQVVNRSTVFSTPN